MKLDLQAVLANELDQLPPRMSLKRFIEEICVARGVSEPQVLARVDMSAVSHIDELPQYPELYQLVYIIDDYGECGMIYDGSTWVEITDDY